MKKSRIAAISCGGGVEMGPCSSNVARHAPGDAWCGTQCFNAAYEVPSLAR